MEFRLRDFRRSDFDTLWSIDQSCFPPGIAYSQLELATYIRRRGSFTLVAEGMAKGAKKEAVASPKIQGFIVTEAGRRRIGHIITIDVLPEARRSGVGSELLAAAEDHLRAAGCQSVVLETAADNSTAVSFYKRHNYFLVKTVPRYYSNGVDALVLEKRL